MSRARTLFPVLISFLFLTGSAAHAERTAARGGSPSTVITVGDFALRVAGLALDTPAERAALTPDKALASLRRAGLKLRSDTEAALTEGDISDFFRQAGLRLEVAQPERFVAPERVGAVLSTFGGYLASHAADPARGLLAAPPDRLSSKIPLPSSFSDCGTLPTVPDCLECCINLPGATSKSCGRACGRAHALHNISPDEPTP